MSEVPTRRPLADRLEIAAPSLAAVAARAAGYLPEPLRRRVLVGAVARAEAAFNRGDYEAVFALFADEAVHVPPPALGQAPITGRAAILDFWRATGARFSASILENLSLEEAAPERFTRTLRITHGTDGEEISYLIRQVTQLRRGRVVSQVNEEID
jgi:ketosteroid isomerase-like protein